MSYTVVITPDAVAAVTMQTQDRSVILMPLRAPRGVTVITRESLRTVDGVTRDYYFSRSLTSSAILRFIERAMIAR